MVARFSSLGGSLVGWTLLREPYTDRFGDPIWLVEPGDRAPTAVTPLLELGLGDLSQQIWHVADHAPGQVRFEFEGEGIRVQKRFELTGEYSYRLSLEVRNDSERSLEPIFLLEVPIQERSGNDFREQSAAALHEGGLEQVPLAGLGSAGFFGFFTGAKGGEPVVYDNEVDWAGVHTPYFLSAHFPDRPGASHARVVSLEPGELGAVQLYFDPVRLERGQSDRREYRGYLGPKEIDRLREFAPSAVESIDLGWSWIAPMTRAFTWLLAVIHTVIPNYGLAIIVLTILVRVVTAPLTVKQMRSMERMRALQPKIKEIQEKYADDRPKQSEQMMALYRQEKVNPLGGCLPMLLQLPVFIGLFYSLRSSIQLRHAPFVGWIDDLSAPDLLFTLPGLDFPVRVLPLLMGASMLAQQKITPMQMDPAQARMMLILMPTMLTLISYTFPSGLVLYWMVSNLLAIAHQLWIGRNMKSADA